MKTLLAFFAVGIAAGCDVVTLGGVCNDAYFHNGRRTYTQRALDEVFQRPTH